MLRKYCEGETYLPPAEGHPDEDDDRMIQQLAVEIMEKITAGISFRYPCRILPTSPPEICAQMDKVIFEQTKGWLPKKEIDHNRCTAWGTCTVICPAQVIRLPPPICPPPERAYPTSNLAAFQR